MLENIHDKFFKKVFSNIENTRDFLYTSLPFDIQNSIDIDNITIDPTSYISNEMKSVFKKDFETIIKVFEFWEDKGFLENKDALLFFFTYIFETKDITPARFEEILKKSKLERSEIMPTLAQRLRQEGRQQGRQQGIKEEKIKIAKKLLKQGLDTQIIINATGLSKEEIKNLKEEK